MTAASSVVITCNNVKASRTPSACACCCLDGINCSARLSLYILYLQSAQCLCKCRRDYLWLLQYDIQRISKPCCICVQVLSQTVANADCNSLHKANYEAWQKLCDELSMCKQLEVQQNFLLHIITEALAANKGASMHQVCYHDYVTNSLNCPLNMPQCLSLRHVW